LLVLLDYERFELIRVLLKNRAKVLFCSKLKQAQTDAARAAIEQEMLADPSGAGAAILQQLSQVATAESWVSDRMADFRTKSLKEAQQLRSMHADADASAAGGGNARTHAHREACGLACDGSRNKDLLPDRRVV
jgi:pre-mRNA-splicing helicase BRR2